MEPLTFLIPILYVVFLWWFTTGLIIAVYGRSQQLMNLFFVGMTVAVGFAFWGLYATRDMLSLWGVYIAVACGIMVWGWQVTGYYLGFVSGPGNKDDLKRSKVWSLRDRFRLALNLTIYHELLVVGAGGFIAWLTWDHANRWGLWIYVALWLMHTSAKVNVFLGVRNFHVEFLPKQLRYIEKLLSKRTSNVLLPISVVAASSVALLLVYRGIEPGTHPAHTVGFLFVATMIGLGIIEHCLLVIPIPSTLVGWQLRAIPNARGQMTPWLQPAYATATPTMNRDWQAYADIPHQTRTAAAKPDQRTRHTYTFERDHGPLVVDVWEPPEPTTALPVLLIHGWGGSGSYWRQTAFELSNSVRVIVPDLPGTGRSQPVKSAQNMFDQVDTLADLLDLLELERVQLVTHSMGGAMGLLLSEKRPERIERVVLTSLSFFLTEEQERIYSNIMHVYRLSMGFRPMWLTAVPGIKQLLAKQYFYNTPNDEKLLEQGLRDYLQLDAGTALACAENATSDAIPEAGAKLQATALLIACRQDRVMPLENVDFTVNTIPACDVRWIDECGHLPMVEKPDEYMTLLHDFLDLGDNKS